MNSLNTLNQMLWTSLSKKKQNVMDLPWLVFFPNLRYICEIYPFYFLFFWKKNWIKCQAVFFVFLWGNSTLVPKWCIHCAAAAYFLFLRMFDENYTALLIHSWCVLSHILGSVCCCIFVLSFCVARGLAIVGLRVYLDKTYFVETENIITKYFLNV